jgi:CRISPR type IV-associated protein Csf1
MTIEPMELFRQGRLTGSWLAVHAAGDTPAVKPGTVPTDPEVPCPMCGYRFAGGECGHPNPTLHSQTFNDAPSMLGSAYSPICGACNLMSQKKYMQALGKAVAARGGLWSLASNESRAWWLLNPPTPPFVMVVANATQQHLYWRTPVATSQDVFPVRIGTHVGLVRRRALAQAKELTQSMLQLMASASGDPARRARKRPPAASRARHPFVSLDREMLDRQHGRLKAEALALLADSATPSAFRIFAELNPIECWALAAVANQKKPLSCAPAPIAVPARPRPTHLN